MGRESGIAWTDATWNPWRGCTKVSEGCDNCYAESMSGRNPGVLGEWGPEGSRAIAAESYWNLPYKWEREAKASGKRIKVFCASLADFFEGPETMPENMVRLVQHARARALSIMQETPRLFYLLLTKRPEKIIPLLQEARHELALRCVPFTWIDRWLDGDPPANIGLGTSVELQQYLQPRVSELLRVPAALHWLSAEPLLGNLYLMPWLQQLGKNGLGWVVVGGESGHGARPMDRSWVYHIMDQCQEACVPFFFKQWGEWLPIGEKGLGIVPGSSPLIELDTGKLAVRAGKKIAGHLLDGLAYQEFPSLISRLP